MNGQHHWLFETPLAHKAGESENLYDSPEQYNHPELEYYINPELAVDWELYDEFGSYNQRFRREITKRIVTDPRNRVLRFLVKRKVDPKIGKRKYVLSRNVDAGHVVPVMDLKRGKGRERLMIEDSRLNRSAGQAMGVTGKGIRTTGVWIGTIPMEMNTVKKLVKAGRLSPHYLRKDYIRTHRTKGWTPSKESELFFLLGESNDWVTGAMTPGGKLSSLEYALI